MSEVNQYGIVTIEIIIATITTRRHKMIQKSNGE